MARDREKKRAFILKILEKVYSSDEVTRTEL